MKRKWNEMIVPNKIMLVIRIIALICFLLLMLHQFLGIWDSENNIFSICIASVALFLAIISYFVKDE